MEIIKTYTVRYIKSGIYQFADFYISTRKT